jgi:hypothetical protein
MGRPAAGWGEEAEVEGAVLDTEVVAITELEVVWVEIPLVVLLRPDVLVILLDVVVVVTEC